MPGCPLQLRHQYRPADAVGHRHQKPERALVEQIGAVSLPLRGDFVFKEREILPRKFAGPRVLARLANLNASARMQEAQRLANPIARSNFMRDCTACGIVALRHPLRRLLRGPFAGKGEVDNSIGSATDTNIISNLSRRSTRQFWAVARLFGAVDLRASGPVG